MRPLILRDLSETIKTKNYTGIMSAISFSAFCLMIMDCAISGGGHWLMVGPLSLRMILGLIAFIFAVPRMLKDLRTWVCNPMLISLALFVIYLGVCAVVGFVNGNRMDVLLSDAKGFVWLAMIPVALTVMDSRERIVFVLKCVAVAATLQALMIIALNITCSLYDNCINVLYEPLIQLQWGFVDNISSSMFRIFSKSGPYLAAGSIIMLFMQYRNKKFNWIYAISTGICFAAILLSYTRSLYGATFVSIVLVVVLSLIFAREYWKKMFMNIGSACAATVVLILVQQAAFGVNYFSFAVVRTMSIDIVKPPSQNEEIQDETYSEESLQQQAYIERTKQSDTIKRDATEIELREMISQSPVFGNGLGASVKYRDTELVEHFYFDIVNKTGMLGLLLYYFPIGYMIFLLLKRGKMADKSSVLCGVTCLSGLTVFLAATYFNPYMNASIGISFYSITIGCFALFGKKARARHRPLRP